MFGVDLRGAKDRKIQRELAQKRAAREYMRHCDQNGICSRDAHLLMPADVKAGMAMIRSENRAADLAAFRGQKEQMANRFNAQGSGS